MVTLSHCVALALCLIHVPDLTFAFPRTFDLNKRFAEGGFVNKRTSRTAPTEIVVDKYEDVVLECNMTGSNNPTIHWLKNGNRIFQGNSKNLRDDVPKFEQSDASKLQIAETGSKLYLDCVTESDEATYTCVAETKSLRKTKNYTVTIVPDSSFDDLPVDCGKCGNKCSRSKPPRIYMWTKGRFEYNNVVTQLYCRAQGKPTPSIAWLDVFGRPIVNGNGYKITNSGDLVILKPNWEEHMGLYTCVADNGVGSDTSSTFFYPTREDGS